MGMNYTKLISIIHIVSDGSSRRGTFDVKSASKTESGTSLINHCKAQLKTSKLAIAQTILVFAVVLLTLITRSVRTPRFRPLLV